MLFPPVPGDKDVGSGGGSVCRALDALPHPGGGQLFPPAGLSGHLVPAVLSQLCVSEQRHQSGYLQCHVTEVPRRLQEALQMQFEGAG